MKKRTYIPDKQTYKETLNRLADSNDMRTLIAVRLACEMGMTRLEIVNARVSDIDRINKRGLWVEVAKRVRRGNKIVNGEKKANFEMRQREIPINSDLYQLLMAYVSSGQMYILRRMKGDIKNHFIPRNINLWYAVNDISWSPHRSRHYFKSQVWSWMMQNKQVDPGLLKELLGHQKTTTEDYGEYAWDYKRDVIDKVFE